MAVKPIVAVLGRFRIPAKASYGPGSCFGAAVSASLLLHGAFVGVWCAMRIMSAASGMAAPVDHGGIGGAVADFGTSVSVAAHCLAAWVGCYPISDGW